MAARTGAQYLAGLHDGREVWLDGERVADVSQHPALRDAAQSVAELFDLQHTEAATCLTPDPETGEPINVTHLLPRSRADLTRRHAAIEAVARHTLGLMGRSPDYLNVTLAGFAARADSWSLDGNERGAANLIAYQREAARRDLCLTHAIIHPTVDKSKPDTAAGDGLVALHKVDDTSVGIRVRGARALATLAPFADEVVVYPGQPIEKEATRYALAFSVPIHTPGLRVLCRDSYSAPGRHADLPLSSHFDEQDAVLIFDDVEIPHERLFLDGSTKVYNTVMTTGWTANIMQQTTIRAAVKLDFAYQLATRMVAALNAVNPTTNEQLGELWTYAELTRAAVCAAEAGAYEWGNGAWFPDERPFRAIRPTLPRWFPRVNEIITLIGAHNLLATPTAAEMAHPQLGPLIAHYYQGANGVAASERIAVMRAAWDFVGSALGGRNQLYERFYLASAARMYGVAHAIAQRTPDTSLVERVLRADT